MPLFNLNQNFSNFLEIINSKNIKLIIFGETHGALEDTKIQEKIISAIKPNYFLYELLEDKSLPTIKEIKDFLNKKDNEDFSIISKYKDLKPTILLAQSKNIPLIGCDIKNLGRKNTDFRSIKIITSKIAKKEEDLLKLRENRQGEVILDHLNKSNILFVSVGAYHLRKDSYLLNNLSKVRYIKVYPSIFGQPLFEPPSKKDLEDLKWVFEEVNG